MPNSISGTRVHRFGAGGKWLCDGELQLCIVQTHPVDPDLIKQDLNRPHVVATLRELLECDASRTIAPAVSELASPGSPKMVMVPEYALGSGDWDVIDRLVRSFPDPLILLTGFGATLGERLNAWREADAGSDSQTARAFGWPDDDPVQSQMRYNGGWCWIHRPSQHTCCLAFRKNFADQSIEPSIVPNLSLGRTSLCIDCEDLVLFPLICADMVQKNPEGPDPLSRIEKLLTHPDAKGRSTLICGLLYQLKPSHPIWQKSISRATMEEHPRCVVALANHAVDTPKQSETEDSWRTLSGTYVTTGRLLHHDPLPTVRPVENYAFTGALVRETHPCVLAGPVRWTYGAQQGRFLWWPGLRCTIDGDGHLASPEAGDADAYELIRFVQRHKPVTKSTTENGDHGRASDGDTVVLQGLDDVCNHVQSGAPPKAASLRDTILHGLAIPAEPQVRADELHTVENSLRAGLFALATLKRGVLTEWQPKHDRAGQLRRSGDHTHFLVWSDPQRSGPEIRRKLQAWVLKPGGHEPLIVFAGCTSGAVDEGHVRIGTCTSAIADERRVRPTRRSDIRAAPVGHTDAFDQPRSERQAHCLPLGKLENCYLGGPGFDAAAAVRDLLNGIDTREEAS